MNIICFGQMNWDWCWTGRHHLTSRLARRGHNVLFVNPVWDRDHADGNKAMRQLLLPVAPRLGLREIDHRLFVYHYPYIHALGWKVNRFLYPRMIRQVARDLAFSDPVVMVMLPRAVSCIGRLRARGLIYYAIDDMSAFGGMSDHEREETLAQEQALLGQAQVAMGVSPRLQERFARTHPRSYLLPNGVDTDHYAPARLERLRVHPRLADIDGPCIGFFGQIDERMDQDLVSRMAERHPQWTIALAGRVKKGVDDSRLTRHANIRFTGFHPYDELPSVVKRFDVCIVPYHLNDLTRACSPIKVYEYLATGKPVVATPLDGLHLCRDVINVAADAETFIRHVEEALHHDTPVQRDARLAMAARNSWEQRTDVLEERLREAAARAPQPKSQPRHHLIFPEAFANHPLHYVYPDKVDISLKSKVIFRFISIFGWVYYALRVLFRLLTGRRPLRVRKILVTRLSRLGDMVVFTPTLAALRRRYPEAEIVLGIHAGAPVHQLLEGQTVVDRVIELHFDHLPTLKKFRKGFALFREGYDLAVAGTAYFVQMEVFFTGAPFRIGLDDGHPLERMHNHILPLDPTRHEADNNLALVEALGLKDVTVEERMPFIPTDQSLIDTAADELHHRLRIPRGARFVTIHPGAQKQSRQWPVDRFARLVEALLERDSQIKVLITGIASELHLATSIMERVPEHLRGRIINSVGQADLFAFMGMLQRSAVFVCNDTGTMHLARAAGVPLVALLGPENERRWGPYPEGRAPAMSLQYEVPCAPCQRMNCDKQYCMTSLLVEEVVEAVFKLLRTGRTESPAGRHRLEAHKTRRNWSDLLAAGMDLPTLAVIICARRGAEEHGWFTQWDRLEEYAAAVSRQTYPRIEILVAVPPGSGHRSGEDMRCVEIPDGNEEDFWQAVLDVTTTEFLTPMTSPDRWHSRKLSDDISTLNRNATGNLAASNPYLNTSPTYYPVTTIQPGMTTFRRRYLQEWLERTGDSKEEGPGNGEPLLLGRSLIVS